MEAPKYAEGRRQFAISVSQVSRCWREIALRTPFIWSGIHLKWGTWREEYTKFLSIILQRSRSHPLDIFVDVTYRSLFNSDVKNGKYPINAHLGALVPEASRWRSFRCFGESLVSITEIMMPLVHLHAPTLESFSVSSLPDDHDYTVLDLFQGGAPMLSDVSIKGIWTMSCLPSLSSVTSLDLERGTEPMGGGEFLDLLRLSPLLECLILSGCVVEPDQFV
jgi:hypothetical protein